MMKQRETVGANDSRLAFANPLYQGLYALAVASGMVILISIIAFATFNLFFKFVLGQDYDPNIFVPYTVITSFAFVTLGVVTEVFVRFCFHRTMYDYPARLALVLITSAFALDMGAYLVGEIEYYDNLNLAFRLDQGSPTAHIASASGTTLAVIVTMLIARPISRLAAYVGVFPRATKSRT